MCVPIKLLHGSLESVLMSLRFLKSLNRMLRWCLCLLGVDYCPKAFSVHKGQGLVLHHMVLWEQYMRQMHAEWRNWLLRQQHLLRQKCTSEAWQTLGIPMRSRYLAASPFGALMMRFGSPRRRAASCSIASSTSSARTKSTRASFNSSSTCRTPSQLSIDALP